MLTDGSSNYRLSPLSPLPLIECALLERVGGNNHEAFDRAALHYNVVRDANNRGRRVFEYRLLLARLTARMHLYGECERLITAADFDSHELRKQEGISDPHVNRYERQLLRFATDCFRLAPIPGVSRQLMSCLVDLARHSDALDSAPALARYAVTTLALSNAIVNEQPPSIWFDGVLMEFCAPRQLTILLSRLTPSAANRVAATLERWRKDDREVYKLFRKRMWQAPGASRLSEMGRWLRGDLSHAPDVVALSLSEVLSQSSKAPTYMIELCEALRPEGGSRNTPSVEEQFEEARRLGDLLPGEGPAALPASGRSKVR